MEKGRLTPSEVAEWQAKTAEVLEQVAIERSVTEAEAEVVEHVLFPNPFTIGEQISLGMADK